MRETTKKRKHINVIKVKYRPKSVCIAREVKSVLKCLSLSIRKMVTACDCDDGFGKIIPKRNGSADELTA